MPIEELLNFQLKGKTTLTFRNRALLQGEFRRIILPWSKVKKTKKAIDMRIFLAMDMCYITIAMQCFAMVMVEQVVQFLEHYCIEQQQDQEACKSGAIC